MPKKLWITYAWIDNEDQDIDYIVQSLEEGGLDVRFDRRNIEEQRGQTLSYNITLGIMSDLCYGLPHGSSVSCLCTMPVCRQHPSRGGRDHGRLQWCGRVSTTEKAASTGNKRQRPTENCTET